jgi:hypothetical protein
MTPLAAYVSPRIAPTAERQGPRSELGARPIPIAGWRVPGFAGKTLCEVSQSSAIYLVREMWRGAALEAVKRGLLSTTEFTVLFKLSDCRGWKDDRAWGCVGELARELGMAQTPNGTKLGDSRTVRNALSRAEDIGLIRRYRRGRDKSDEFALVFPDPTRDHWGDAGKEVASLSLDDTQEELASLDCIRGKEVASLDGKILPGNLNSKNLNSISPTTALTAGARSPFESELWIAFRQAYPFTPSLDFARAREAFDELSPKDAEMAIRAAKAYAADLERRGHSMPAEAWRWISERRFVAIAEALPATASKDSVKPRVFVERGTDAWAAWGPVWRQKNGGRHGPPVVEHGGRNGWWFESLYPSAADEGGGGS